MSGQILTCHNYNPKGIIYGFIGKKLALSSHHYRAKDENAKENISRILGALGKSEYSMSLVDQVHSNKCLIVDDVASVEHEKKADAHVTNKRNIILGIKTADCIPILFIDAASNVIGAAHSGWRGALSGIIESTVKKMIVLGAKENDIDVVIGPCIHQPSYEVGEDFIEKFIEESNDNQKFFIPSIRKNHMLFDLPGYAKEKLNKYNFKNVFDVNIDTFKDEENCFSYRRCTLRKEPLDGQILSVVGFK